ncbi:serine hydrolase domain-containing protein [Flavobacterium sp. SM2513]|uniref:serine hydrolase domain-containing protein n=1 Tax=Flavobacterium sp. SM2513 TaxID=3424766 RepID=UPI003D7F2F32
MKFQNTLLFLFILFSFAVNAQDMADYTDNWEGKIENPKTFNLKVEITDLGFEKAVFKIYNNKNSIDFPFDATSVNKIKIPFAENLFFEGILSKDNKEINGFIKSGLLLYHLKLTKSNHNSYTGDWNILMVTELKSQDFYLSVENGSKNEYQAYPILGDNRFTGTWCDNFQKENNIISFSDFKTGLQFKGKLAPNTIQLGIYLGTHLITEIELKKSKSDWKIGGFETNHKTSILKLTEMEHLILKDSLPNTHSVLISRKGKLIYENYFEGYTANIPHDMRSSAKSISSAIVGIALDKSLFKSVNQSIFDFLPTKYQAQKDPLKAKINIQSLLTMSSGLDAIDYGINANLKSPATEDNFQRAKDWIGTILAVPMINTPNTKANYGSANPYLLGIAMDSMITEPVELFMDRNLFQKLAISNYIIQADLNGNPYFGGGMYLTSTDMLKFGELYLNDGKWNSKRIISSKWIKHSFKNYRVLENTKDKNGYGYLWWHHTYQVNGKSFESIEARGAGGQYIFVIPSLKTVAVITSGNFRNGKTQQPEMIFENYILPHLKK